ncbi:hypothetical protein [Aquimarina spongiae]|uniref:Uncharacterized protein n=1 Tax=Aquimarina spongiae TaxID=570521 RepID=A0A1M6GJ89_9FLAO|nr:hypothetical protein [Aquimarina spongiae]SHJ09989.1 hypothetical protein SAMN04488508_105309 [Aquimarina spongiae]
MKNTFNLLMLLALLVIACAADESNHLEEVENFEAFEGAHLIDDKTFTLIGSRGGGQYNLTRGDNNHSVSIHTQSNSGALHDDRLRGISIGIRVYN